jgi:hypothetical protein
MLSGTEVVMVIFLTLQVQRSNQRTPIIALVFLSARA